MSDRPEAPARKRTKLLVPVIGAAAALLLTAGAAFGVQGYNAETSRRCADAAAAARGSAAVTAGSVDKAAKARALADSVKGYDKADGATVLLTGVAKAKQDLPAVGTACRTRDEAATLISGTQTAETKAAVLNDAAGKLSAHVAVFQAAETKRIIEKKAADEKVAAAKKKAEDEAAAKLIEAAAAQSAATQPLPVPAYAAPAAVPAPVDGGYAAAPVQPAPVPAPHVPAQAPAPAHAPVTGGWTPPPAGQGHSAGSCTQIGDYVMCVGPH